MDKSMSMSADPHDHNPLLPCLVTPLLQILPGPSFSPPPLSLHHYLFLFISYMSTVPSLRCPLRPPNPPYYSILPCSTHPHHSYYSSFVFSTAFSFSFFRFNVIRKIVRLTGLEGKNKNEKGR
jgi:hypothetical protein